MNLLFNKRIFLQTHTFITLWINYRDIYCLINQLVMDLFIKLFYFSIYFIDHSILLNYIFLYTFSVPGRLQRRCSDQNGSPKHMIRGQIRTVLVKTGFIKCFYKAKGSDSNWLPTPTTSTHQKYMIQKSDSLVLRLAVKKIERLDTK